MNTNIRNVATVFFAFLMVANVYVFLSGLSLGADINHYEEEISRLHTENMDLEKKAYELSSLTHAASIAATLSFTKHSTPVYLESLKYALNR